MNRLPIIAFGAAFALFVSLGLWMWIAVWNECRESHTFLYCFLTLTR